MIAKSLFSPQEVKKVKNTKKPKKQLTPEEKLKLQKRIKNTGIRVGITSLILCLNFLIKFK